MRAEEVLSEENLRTVFRAYDVRGMAEREINELLYFATGYICGKIFGSVCVAHDHREHSEKYAMALIKGLSTGCKKIFFLKLVPTPLVQFASRLLECDAGIMVTASHNPKEYNGIKIFRRECRRAEWEKIREMILEEKEKILKEFSIPRAQSFNEIDVKDAYKKFLKESFGFEHKYRIVIDGSNGPMGNLAVDVLREFGFEPIPVACEIDCNFPSHEPDPSKEKNTELCKKAVLEHKADFGICFDGDGDRVIFIDDKARFIPGDYTLAIISLLYPKPKVVTEVKVSKGVVEFIENSGGSVILERVGNVFVRKTLVERNADLGGEYSGHYFFREYPVDDSLYATLKVISVLEKMRKPLSEIFDSIPKYHSSPEIRIKVSEKSKWKIVEDAREYFAGKGKIIAIDGVRVESEDAWGLIRASNTEPKISVRVEGRTKEKYEEMLESFSEFLKKYGIEVVEWR